MVSASSGELGWCESHDSKNRKMLFALMAVMTHKRHSSSGCNFKRLFRASESLHCSSEKSLPVRLLLKCRRKAEQVGSGPIMGVFQKGFAEFPSELPPC